MSRYFRNEVLGFRVFVLKGASRNRVSGLRLLLSECLKLDKAEIFLRMSKVSSLTTLWLC